MTHVISLDDLVLPQCSFYMEQLRDSLDHLDSLGHVGNLGYVGN